MEQAVQILDELKQLNKTANAVMEKMPDKPSKFDKIFGALATGVGIGGIVGIVAQIIAWLPGGK
jgi:Na+/alanine symporter